jgi:predicted ATPase/class 3 adenylate cyclase
MVRAPGGTATFLFTDIEGSTARWENDPAAMAPALARHDTIVRSAIENNGGLVFKTVGDAFCAVFARADAAASAALEAQRNLANADFSEVGGVRVRMAIHTGTTIEREADYFGPTVNRVARLLAIGHGGQTLLSGVSAALVREALGAGTSLDDLGEHALKDVRVAERVFQLSPAGVRADFPPLRAPRTMASNLPFAVSSFVGREDDVTRISAELGRSRAVTLVGTGGIGKTRCALEVASQVTERFRHGVRLVELTSVTDAESVAPAIAAAFDIALLSGEPALETLVRALQSRRVLAVVDNCEHVVAEAARVVDCILQRCPEATVLATSREPLNIRGESVYRLPSLSLPSEGAPLDARSALHFDAIALFVHRAKAAQPRFVLDDAVVGWVAAICRRLDGIALAIELAASRLRALGIRELLERLNERFRLLTGGARTGLPRQQTMRALVDWSYDLLSPAERVTFRRLAIFTHRFDLAAAIDICSRDSAESDFGTIDLLESLVDKSLVAVEIDDREGDRPYRLIETLREYAHEKLVEAGEADAAYERLTLRCIARARTLEESWAAGGAPAWSRECEAELDDLRTALGWALERRRDVPHGLELAACSRRIWSTTAAAEGRRWLLLAKDLLGANVDGREAACIWLGVAQLHVALGLHAVALEAAEHAIEGFTGGEDEASCRESEMFAGFSLALLGDIQAAKPLLSQALAAFEALGLEHLAAVAATDLAAAHVAAEEFDDARRLFREALARFLRFADTAGIDAVTVGLSELEFRFGDVDSAIRVTLDAIANRTGDAPSLMLANMSAYLCALERYDEARAYAREGLLRAEAMRQGVDVAFSIQHLAAVATLEAAAQTSGDAPVTFVNAARLLGYVDAALEMLSSAREFTERREYDRAIAALVPALGRPLFDRALREGAAWNEHRAIASAMQL